MIKTFDQWNKEETRRIVEKEDKDTARLVRKARSGGMARFTLWDDYLAASQTDNFQVEAN